LKHEKLRDANASAEVIKLPIEELKLILGKAFCFRTHVIKLPIEELKLKNTGLEAKASFVIKLPIEELKLSQTITDRRP